MKLRILMVSAALALVTTPVLADIYQVNFGWTDPTTYLPSDTPRYNIKYRVTGSSEGAGIIVSGLTIPSGTVSVSAIPGELIEVAARACNLTLCSAWTDWVTATAPYPATQPATQTGLTITVVRIGP